MQSIPIPQWKWEVIYIDLIICLSRTSKQHDSIMDVVDSLSKVSHFISVKSMNSTSEVAHIFIREIVGLHGVSKRIISNKHSKFIFQVLEEVVGKFGDRVGL